MPEIMLYLTRRDAENFRQWVNSEPDLTWIIKEAQSGCDYTWKAVPELVEIAPQEYCLWRAGSSELSIPSGSSKIKDTPIPDPFRGWCQRLPYANATAPWFGANFPGPYFFRFAEVAESSGTIARSGLFWHGDRYRSIGMPATDSAKIGWKRLQSYVKRMTIAIPWPYDRPIGKHRAYAFEDAYLKIGSGTFPVTNPSV